MHLHRYEKLWLKFGIIGLIAFLIVLGFGAFYLGTHPQSHGVTIDPNNLEAVESFKEENLGLTEIREGEYVLNVIASAFNYDLGTDENGDPVTHLRIPKGATLLVQATTPDVVHGFNIAGTNVNMMVEPGYISAMEVEMKQAGDYTLLCNEYCGTGHHLMYATVEVYE